MGACNIDFELKGKATKDQINKAFLEQQKIDSEYNGSRDGYSGDFQTVQSIKYNLDKIFDSYDDAQEYCLEHAEKWSYAVGVYYKTNAKVKTSTKYDKLMISYTNTQQAYRDLTYQAELGIKNAKSKTIGCKHCESKVSRTYVNGTDCPVCKNSLLSTTFKNRLQKANEKVTNAKRKLIECQKSDQKKVAKNASINTLICGWGAC